MGSKQKKVVKLILAFQIFGLYSCEPDCESSNKLDREEEFVFVITNISRHGRTIQFEGYQPQTKQKIYDERISGRYHVFNKIFSVGDTVQKDRDSLFFVIKKDKIMVKINLDCNAPTKAEYVSK